MNPRWINTCLDCDAVREYPSGRAIDVCPRCNGKRIRQTPAPKTRAELERHIIEAISEEKPNADRN